MCDGATELRNDRRFHQCFRAEKRSGTTTEGRAELRTVLDFLRRGDVLVVTRVDRLARSIGDLQDIVRDVKARGATLKATEQPIDTSTAAGKCFLDMLGVFAEFETNLAARAPARRDRQGQVGRRVHGPPGLDRCGQGARIEGAGRGTRGDC